MRTAGYPYADEIDRTRAGFRRRMQEIDRLHTMDVKALDKSMKEWAELAVADVRLGVVKAVVDCFAALVRRTPVDTGRARAGWQVGTSITESKPPQEVYPEYQNKTDVSAALAEALPPTSELSKADVIYVLNNVEYILALDAGWSRKQPGGFIGLFLQELRYQLEAMAVASRGTA